jgi:hypothetical protein
MGIDVSIRAMRASVPIRDSRGPPVESQRVPHVFLPDIEIRTESGCRAIRKLCRTLAALAVLIRCPQQIDQDGHFL